jgi:hypothetical protein
MVSGSARPPEARRRRAVGHRILGRRGLEQRAGDDAGAPVDRRREHDGRDQIWILGRVTLAEAAIRRRTLNRHDAVLKCQFDALAGYVSEAKPTCARPS